MLINNNLITVTVGEACVDQGGEWAGQKSIFITKINKLLITIELIYLLARRMSIRNFD